MDTIVDMQKRLNQTFGCNGHFLDLADILTMGKP